jgi:glyoxylase-like metal-dependent hydrolase (beta-lactamase superfamily II)
MAILEVVGADRWYETLRMADDVTLIHEPWIKPFFRCNMWHVCGRDRDLLFDSGPRSREPEAHVPLVTGRPIVCVASHTHFDHIGSHHEFADRCVHAAEADILADPRNEWTLADLYANDEMFDRCRRVGCRGLRDPARPGGAHPGGRRCRRPRRPRLRGGPHARSFARRHRPPRAGHGHLPVRRHRL